MKQKILYILIMICLAGCGKKHDPRLQRIEEMCSVNPVAALDSLDAIDCESLSDADRHYYEFLKVKVPDKAYVVHESDSLIRRVIDYESGHKECGRYAESLYYGGRVCSDLGDYPAAMGYFQEALSEVDKEPGNLDLKANIASQYGRLLNSLRMYDEAIPLIQMSINIDKQKKDTVNAVYDLQLLGAVRMHAHEYKSAEHTFREALSLSKNLSVNHRAKSSMYIAAIKNRIGQNDSALLYIRDALPKVKPITRNMALACAAEISMDAGITDTAYLYAKELTENKDPNNKLTGYQILLSPQLRSMIGNNDSISHYFTEYGKVFERNFDNNEVQLSLMQQSMFNYQQQVKEKEKAQKKSNILFAVVICAVLVCMIMSIVALIMKNRNKANRIRLHAAIENINRLEAARSAYGPNIVTAEEIKNEGIEKENVKILFEDPRTEEELRECLRNKLLSAFEAGGEELPEVSPAIISSPAYGALKEKIEQGMEIKENDSFWKDLEKVVAESSPEFKSNLKLLAGGRFSSYDFKTALLIKCGTSTGEMAKLFGRSKGAMVSRRHSLSERIFDEQKSTKVMDGIIRLL